MKIRDIVRLICVLYAASFLAWSAQAAEGNSTVNVALLDMTAVGGHGMMGPRWGMMGPGGGSGPGWGGMMGPGWGGPGSGYGGMMGSGPGQGMMGMGMMSIRTDKSSVKAGEVHFAVRNWSRGLVHEMLVIAVDNPNAPLPYDYGTGVVPEDQVKDLGEISDLEPNGSGTLDIKLVPGTYLLLCNLPGHYAAGMVTPLTVTP